MSEVDSSAAASTSAPSPVMLASAGATQEPLLMNGHSNGHASSSTPNAPPRVQGYSFYLNVVLLSADRERDNSSNSSEANDTVASNNKTSTVAVETESNKDDIYSATVVTVPAATPQEDAANKMKKMMTDGKFLMGLARASIKSPLLKHASNSESSNALGNFGASVAKSTRRFMGNRTMMSRAETAVVEIIPTLQRDIGLSDTNCISINKRFQQGTVFVLEVDIKGTDLLPLMESVMGREQAQHFAQARSACQALRLPKAQHALEQEVLPQVRLALMQKLSALVPQRMQQRKQTRDLEIECIALEDAEEAKWLYNFLEFMNAMNE